MERNRKTIVVMPAFNAEKTLKKTVDALPPGSADEIILVDDASTDQTARCARELGLTVVVHEKNLGYGGNQKTCYRTALDHGADVVVMVHPDYQYDPRLVPYLSGLIKDDICDIVMANRIRTRREALAGGMPLYKYISNRGLTIVENVFLGLNLSEYHTGYRAYSRKALELIAWEGNSNDFVFDQQILIQAAALGLRIGEIPVPARYFEEASSINFMRSTQYGLATLYHIFRFTLHRCGLWRSKDYLPRRRAD
jgi:glycosyltransferase involved in cell wall biosynthesis